MTQNSRVSIVLVCACVQGMMKDKTLTRTWQLAATGVSVDDLTPLGAILMGGSVFLYAFIQVCMLFSQVPCALCEDCTLCWAHFEKCIARMLSCACR